MMLMRSTVNIPAGVKHWHGAAPDSSNEWLETVDDAAYREATAKEK